MPKSHIKNSNKNVINIHIHEKKQKKKRKHKHHKRREHEGVSSYYPVQPTHAPYLPPSAYLYNNDRPDNNQSLLNMIDARLKRFENSHEPKSSNLTNQVTQEHENTFMANEEGDVIPTDGSFFANIHVKRHNGQDHYLFNKVEPTLENQVKAVGEDEVIIPVPVEETFETPKKTSLRGDIFGDQTPQVGDVYDMDEQVPTTSNPLFDIAGGVVGTASDAYFGLPSGTSSKVGSYFLGGSSDKSKAIDKYEESLAQANTDKSKVELYKELVSSFKEFPDDKVTDAEWASLKQLAKDVGYDMKKLSNKRQRKVLMLKKINSSPLKKLVADYDAKQADKIKTIEEEKKQRIGPSNKAEVHTLNVPQNMPTNSIKKASKKAESKSKSDSGLSIGNILSGVTAVGGAGLVATGMAYKDSITSTMTSLLENHGNPTGGARAAAQRQAAINQGQSEISITSPDGRRVADLEKAGSKRVSKKGTPINRQDLKGQQLFTDTHGAL